MSDTGSTQSAPRHHKQLNVPLWTSLSVVAALGVTIALTALDDAKGLPIFDNQTLNSTVSGILLVAAAVAPSYIQNRRDTKEIKHEVKNDHTKNLRVEQDQRFHISSNQNMTIIERLDKLMASQANQNRKLDALDRKFDRKVDALREEQQAVQHQNELRMFTVEQQIKRG